MHEGVPVSQAWLWRIIAPRHKSRRDQPFNVETHLLRWTSDNLPSKEAENSRPMTAPTCAVLLAEPRRSSRLLRLACKVVGRATALRAPNLSAGTEAQARCSTTYFVISSRKRGIPSAESAILRNRGLLQGGGGGMANQSRACVSIQSLQREP